MEVEDMNLEQLVSRHYRGPGGQDRTLRPMGLEHTQIPLQGATGDT